MFLWNKKKYFIPISKPRIFEVHIFSDAIYTEMFRLWCHSFDCRFAQKKRILRFEVFQIKSVKVFRKGESKGLIKGKKRWWYSKSVIGGCHCSEVQNFCIIYQVYNKNSVMKIVKEQSYMERKNIHINFSGSITLCLVKCIQVSYRCDMIFMKVLCENISILSILRSKAE